MRIVEEIDADSLASLQAMIVSCHGVYYMSYTDGELDDLIHTFRNSPDDVYLVDKFIAEKRRRERLEE